METKLLRSMLCVLLSVVLALSAGLIASADQSDGGFTYIADAAKKTAQITGYTGSSIMVTIPETIGGYTVTSIKGEAFKGKSSIISMTIPKTVTAIGNEAFSGCTFLNSLKLGSGVSSIGSKAFENCIALSSVSIPAATSSIGERAFSGCSGLTKFDVDALNPAYKSENGVLLNRLGTNLIVYPAKRSGASYDAPSVLTIESYAFNNASNLTSVKLSDTTTTVGKGAFKDCSSLKKVQLPSKLTKIDDELFMGCKKLNELNFPATVKTIGENAFNGCTAIPAVSVPDTVTTVGKGAFANCTGVTVVSLGKGVTAVSGSAFSGCPAIKEFKAPNNTAFSVDKGVLFDKDGKILVAYPAGSTASEYTVGEKVTTLGENAFDSCKSLKKITVPATVKKFNDPVVKNCGTMEIHVEDKSEAQKYFSAHTSGYGLLKVGSDMPGDVNADGTVDNADVILLRRYVAKWKNITIQKDAADVNKDSEIDNADVILIRRYVAGWKNVTLK